MPLRVRNISFDCDDVQKVARFWSAALDRPLDPGSGPRFASIGGGDGVVLKEELSLKAFEVGDRCSYRPRTGASWGREYRGFSANVVDSATRRTAGVALPVLPGRCTSG
jgi:hypothetical protein